MNIQSDMVAEDLNFYLFFQESDQNEYRFPEKSIISVLIDDSFDYKPIFKEWIKGGKIVINLLIFQKISDNQLAALEDFFNSKEFQSNSNRIIIKLIHENELKEYALGLYCKFRSQVEKSCPPCGLSFISRKEQIDREIISNRVGLDIIRIYYDVDAISETLDINDSTGYEYPKAMEKDIIQHGYIDEKFWYWHPESTRLWRKLTFSEKYTVYQYTKLLLERYIEEIVNELFKSLGERSTIDFIDLGVGSPDKDKIIISKILERFNNSANNSNKLIFYMFDISFSLILQTISHILPLKREMENPNQLDVIPIVGDFNDLSKWEYQELLGESNPKLFTLLGNTIGNLLENDLLNNLSPYIQNNGYLLLDVEFHDGVSKKEIIGAYDTKEMFDFVVHPLRLVGKVRQQDKDAIHLYRVDLSESNQIEYSFGRRGSSHSVSNIKGCKVISMKYREDQNREYLLAWSTKYGKIAFESHLHDLGFRTIQSYFYPDRQEEFGSNKNPRYGLYLLQKDISPDSIEGA